MKNKTSPSFQTSDKDFKLIHEIAKRAAGMAHHEGLAYDLMSLTMDITACHANGNPLRLAELLEADDGNFGHDVFGITRFIDRTTGKMMNFFRPRFSVSGTN